MTTLPIPLLNVEGLCGGYGAAQILFDISLQVQRGEVVALLGRNGAGKSTLLKALMGLLPGRQGRVSFMGQDISTWPPYRIAQRGLGFVPEDRRVFTGLSVMDNLEVGRQRPRLWPDGTAAPLWTAEKLFALFPNLGEMRQRPGGRMSGGEQQMLAVARTLMGNPLLVLLDEPSEGLAPLIVGQMAQAISALKARGVGVLLSEQNQHFASAVADRAYVLAQGQLRFAGTLAELAQDGDVKRSFLGV